MTVRRPLATDAQKISELLAQLGYDADIDLVMERLALLNENEQDGAFVAENEGEVIGCISVHTFELFHKRARAGRITALIVDAAQRSKGVGRSLVEKAEEFCISRNCIRVEVTSGEARVDAHRFYVTRGYALGKKYFVKPIPSEP